MKTIWLNDLHLEFLDDSEFHRFLVTLGKQKADSVLIAGDIAQAPRLTGFLSQMEAALGAPIYFVLGNHDFYHGSILGVRAAIQSLVERSSRLHWLNTAGVVALSASTSLVGHDGRYCDPDWLPFFACKAIGEVLIEAMRDHPDKRMTVLCGHTRGGGKSAILPNLVTLTGPATYGQPAVQGVLEWK